VSSPFRRSGVEPDEPEQVAKASIWERGSGAQEQLMEAIRMLQSIPFWSGSYGKAQEQLKVYQAQAKRVEEMVTALQTAARAAHKSENPPHPTARWVEIQGLWREAIARLEELPTNSDLQPLAQQKIKEYKQNLAAANQRLVKERNSQQRLQEAKDAALIAEARQGVAQSLENWQLVYGHLANGDEAPQADSSRDNRLRTGTAIVVPVFAENVKCAG
jgi:hypothetical protein